MNASPPIVRKGLQLARRRTRLGSRSFYLASFVLDGARRAGAYSLYAFLRGADDAADGPGDAAIRSARIAERRDSLQRVYTGRPADALEYALAWTVSRFGIPRGPIESLLETVAHDVGRVRVPTWQALDDYCYGVASTVGLAMAPLLGAPERALDAAAALGRAMQLTNVLRDVREDLELDRVYLPDEALKAAGVTEGALRLGTPGGGWTDLARAAAARAHEAYGAAEPGILAIAPWRSRATVRLMRAVYREILVEIERRDYDVFSSRVVIGTPRKLWLATRVLAGADPAASGGDSWRAR
jgi:phytoene synthase